MWVDAQSSCGPARARLDQDCVDELVAVRGTEALRQTNGFVDGLRDKNFGRELSS